jgi:hypothetical protein
MQRKKPVPSGPCYSHRFTNGVWQIFDRCYYGVVDAKPNERAAAERARQLNERKAQPAQVRR